MRTLIIGFSLVLYGRFASIAFNEHRGFLVRSVLASLGKRSETKNRRSISGSAKCDRRVYRSSIRTLRAQPNRYRIERNASWSTSRQVCDAEDYAKRSCCEHQNFGKPIGSQNAHQHGDPHSPPNPQ
jgi:hypothetical protein